MFQCARHRGRCPSAYVVSRASQHSLILCVAYLAAIIIEGAGAEKHCSRIAANIPLEQSWLQETSTPGARPLPSIQDQLLGYSDWPDGEDGLPEKVTNKTHFIHLDCHHNLVSRYKWYNGTLYTDLPSNGWLGRRRHTVEMLIISKWLYKDLPDMDIVISVEDQALRCNAPLPFLQSTALNWTSAVTGQPFEINQGHLVQSVMGTENITHINHTCGYAIPYDDIWRDWSLSRDQLRGYSTCVQHKHGNGVTTSATPRQSQGANPDPWAAARTPRLVWRGSTTGFFKGWPKGASTNISTYSNPLQQALWNKRLYMCAMARPYPWLDLGITQLHQRWILRGQKANETEGVLRHLKPLVMRPGITVEAQCGYQLALSIDGNGAPWRLPRQLLGLTPIVKVDSPYQEFFAKRLKPGVHFEPVKYDLSDLVATTKRLIDEIAINSTRLQQMAVATQEVAVQHLNALAQLDSFVWSLQKLKAAYAWQVEAPELEKSIKWHPVLLPDGDFMSSGLRHIRASVQRMFPNNFFSSGTPSPGSMAKPAQPSNTSKVHRL